MLLPLRVLGVPFASRGSGIVNPAGETTSLDFAVSGAGSRLQGMMVTSLDNADTGATAASEVLQGSEGGEAEEGEAGDRASAADEWAGFVVKDGPTGQVRHCLQSIYSSLDTLALQLS